MSERRLKNRYEVLSTLGRGPVTSTHLALDHASGRRCVVKVLSLQSADALKAHELLMREARVLQSLDHPRIPRFVDYFTEEEGTDTRVCLVQQHADGNSLADLVRSGKRFTEKEACRIGAKLAGILEYLHGFSPPILHRDLKPANVLLTAGGSVYLVDFGAVRDHLWQRPVLHPGAPTVVGTPGYMPLEQFEGQAVPGSDLYSLGATLLTLLSGRQPAEIEKDGLRLDIGRHLAVSPGLARLLGRLLEPDWRDRPTSAADVRAEFERLASAPPRPPRAPSPRVAAGIGLLILAAAAALGVLLAGAPRPRAPDPRSPGPGGAPAIAEPPVEEGGSFVVRPTADPLPAEAEPVPREALPEGHDVSSLVTVETQTGFTVYRFSGPLRVAQTLDLDLGLGSVWVGTSRGLLRHDPGTGAWWRWDATSGLPGERLDEIAVVGERVVVDSSTPSGAHSVRGTGVLALDTARHTWSLLDAGRVWDLWGDGETLWLGLGTGAEARDLEAGSTRRFTREAGQLRHDAVHAVRRHGSTVWFAMMGDWVAETKDFAGGGVTVWDRDRERFQSYTVRDGLARDYSCDIFVDESEAWVAHWDEERGLSRLDRRTGRWETVRRSADGVDLGGVVLAGEADALWIGQQGALVRLDRRGHGATAFREADGLPGTIVSGLAVGEDSVWASVYAYGADGVRSAGLVRFPRR